MNSSRSKCDISRRADLTEKVVYALVIALLTCMGFHHFDKAKAVALSVATVALGPAGCASQPAYSVSVHAAIASDDELLPKTGRTSPKPAATVPALAK